MMKYIVLLSAASIVLVSCKPPADSYFNTDKDDDLIERIDDDVMIDEDDDAMEENDDDSVEEGEQKDDDGATEDTEDKSDKAMEDVVKGDVNFVAYENKAVGYTIQRPNNWYWDHLIKNQISASDPNVDDYFRADRNPLPGLGTEYLGRIVIAVMQTKIADIRQGLSDLSSSSTEVDGIAAMKYDGVRGEQTWIEYNFEKGERTFRIFFSMNGASKTDTAAFQKVAESFKFN